MYLALNVWIIKDRHTVVPALDSNCCHFFCHFFANPINSTGNAVDFLLRPNLHDRKQH